MLYFCSPNHDAGWSSPVARWAHNPKVGGSNPPPATKGGHRASFLFYLRLSRHQNLFCRVVADECHDIELVGIIFIAQDKLHI